MKDKYNTMLELIKSLNKAGEDPSFTMSVHGSYYFIPDTKKDKRIWFNSLRDMEMYVLGYMEAKL